jgi:hypothetical protein
MGRPPERSLTISPDIRATVAVTAWMRTRLMVCSSCDRGAFAIASACRSPGCAAPAGDGPVRARRVAGRGSAALGRDARGRAPMGRRVAHGRTSGAGGAPARQEKTRRARPHCQSPRPGPALVARGAHDPAGAPDHRTCLRRAILRVERARDPPPTRVFVLTQEGLATPQRAAPRRSKPPAHPARADPNDYFDPNLDGFRAVPDRDPKLETHHASRIPFTARRGTANVASRPEARARYTSSGSTRAGAPTVMRVSLGLASTAARLATISSVG